jgi:hypothetical protein
MTLGKQGEGCPKNFGTTALGQPVRFFYISNFNYIFVAIDCIAI